MIYSFELQGVMPCIFHADDIDAADALKAWRDDPKNKDQSIRGDDRSPPWTWQAYLYHDGEHLVVPAENVMRALRTAGALIKIPGKQTTFKAASQSGLLIVTEHCEFLGPKGKVPIADLHAFREESYAVHHERVQAFGFRLFKKRAAVQQAKNVRVRARFEEWTVRGRIKVLKPIITGAVLLQMFELAGSDAGLLDWRPSSPKSPGPYGTFTARLKKAG